LTRDGPQSNGCWTPVSIIVCWRMKAKVMRLFDWHIYCCELLYRFISFIWLIYYSNVFHTHTHTHTRERECISHDNYVITSLRFLYKSEEQDCWQQHSMVQYDGTTLSWSLFERVNWYIRLRLSDCTYVNGMDGKREAR